MLPLFSRCGVLIYVEEVREHGCTSQPVSHGIEPGCAVDVGTGHECGGTGSDTGHGGGTGRRRQLVRIIFYDLTVDKIRLHLPDQFFADPIWPRRTADNQ